MKRSRIWIIAGILAASAGYVAIQNNQSRKAVQDANAIPITRTISAPPSDAPTSTLLYEGCAFVWAYHDAPEISDKVDGIIRSINPDASANARLYGEDCIYSDGHSTFGAMETDFYVRLPTDDLTKKDEFGNWMAQVLNQLTQIPRDEIQGSFGFVEFWFLKNDTENLTIRVPVQQYMKEAQGISGTELFQIFENAP